MESTEPVQGHPAANRTGEADLLLRAIELARAGEATAARVLLVDICRKNHQSELGWLWLASVARNPKEALACINQVLRINPNNEHAHAWAKKLTHAVAAPSTDVAASSIGSLAQAVAKSPVRCNDAEAVSAAEPKPVQEALVPEEPVTAEPAPSAPEVVHEAKVERSAADPTATVLKPGLKMAPVTMACPLCAVMLETAERCSACHSLIWPSDPMQFVLNGQVDRGWAASVVEMLKTEPESVGNHLSIALACCNLLDFAEARNYLAKAELLDGDAAQFVSDRMDAFLRRPIVLVVDDSATVRDGLARTLDSGGLLPIPIGESWTVLAVAQSQRPAVVLLDVNMPMMDGYEVCRQLRAHRDSKAVPVILISGRHGLMDKVMGKLAGASEYVTKPYPADKLMKIVQSYVPGKQ